MARPAQSRASRCVEGVDIQRLNAHGDHEPGCSRPASRDESALIPAFDGARCRRLTTAATQPRFLGSALRLFAALTLPEALVDRLVSVQRVLDVDWPARSVHWVRREQIHLTLRFYGNVPPEQAPVLTEALRAACADTRPLSLAVAGLGAFPNPRRPRVLWAGVTGDLEPLERLEQRIESATAAFGNHRETRPFQPHLTLGRIAGDRDRQAALPANARWDRIENELFGTWTATTVHLIRSELDPAGARYTTLAVAAFLRV